MSLRWYLYLYYFTVYRILSCMLSHLIPTIWEKATVERKFMERKFKLREEWWKWNLNLGLPLFRNLLISTILPWIRRGFGWSFGWISSHIVSTIRFNCILCTKWELCLDFYAHSKSKWVCQVIKTWGIPLLFRMKVGKLYL